MRTALVSVAALLVASSAPAWAQKKKKGESSVAADKGDARTLLASGLKLFAAKDYLGALSVFESAYERYPSPKILLNIGTTLLKLDRKAEAANIYQKYLDAKDVDSAKQAEAKKILSGLDKELGVLDIEVVPDFAELQFGGDGKWMPADTVKRFRVVPGEVSILARATKHKLRAETLKITAGETRGLTIRLDEEVVEVAPATRPIGGGVATGGGVSAKADRDQRSRLAAYASWHVDVLEKGSFGIIGLSFDALPRLGVQAAGVVGGSYGGYVGATYAFLPGKLRPMVVVGAPVVFVDGPRFAVRGAAGVEYVFNKRFSVMAEAGVQRFLNVADNYAGDKTVFVPAIGATARL